MHQQTLKYPPVQQLKMVLLALLAGAKAVSQTNLTLGVDAARCQAFGWPDCADQAVIAATLHAASPADGLDLQAAFAETLGRYGQARRHALTKTLLVLAVNLSPLPASRQAEGSERGYLGRSRPKTGRKLVRGRASQSHATRWEPVVPRHPAESLAVLEEALTQGEQCLELAGEDEATQTKRGRVEIRLDRAWDHATMMIWVLAQGAQVMGKFKSSSRVRKQVRGITAWQSTSSPGRKVALVPTPVPFIRPVAQFAGRMPSQEKAGGYYQAVFFTTHTTLRVRAVWTPMTTGRASKSI
jgi:hypothetical protein